MASRCSKNIRTDLLGGPGRQLAILASLSSSQSNQASCSLNAAAACRQTTRINQMSSSFETLVLMLVTASAIASASNVSLLVLATMLATSKERSMFCFSPSSPKWGTRAGGHDEEGPNRSRSTSARKASRPTATSALTANGCAGTSRWPHANIARSPNGSSIVSRSMTRTPSSGIGNFPNSVSGRRLVGRR